MRYLAVALVLAFLWLALTDEAQAGGYGNAQFVVQRSRAVYAPQVFAVDSGCYSAAQFAVPVYQQYAVQQQFIPVQRQVFYGSSFRQSSFNFNFSSGRSFSPFRSSRFRAGFGIGY